MTTRKQKSGVYRFKQLSQKIQPDANSRNYSRRNYRIESHSSEFQTWLKGIKEEISRKQNKIRNQQKRGKAYKNLEVCWLKDHGL